MTMLVRYLSVMLLSAMILTGSLAQAHDAVMGNTIGLPAHVLDHRDHPPDETGRTGTTDLCEICGAALAGDCVAAFCHADLIVESRNAPTEGAQVLHHPSLTPDRQGMITEVRTPPPRHLLLETQISFPQEIA